MAQKQLVESRRALMVNIFNQFEDIKPILNEAITLVEEGIFDEAFDTLNEESIAAKMKAKFNAAVQTAKEKGKNALTSAQETIIKVGGKIANVIKLMVSKLKEWVSHFWEAATSHAKKAVGSNQSELEKAINSAAEKEGQKAIIKEVKMAKNDAGSLSKWVMSGFPKEAAKAASNATTNEQFEINLLDNINESLLKGDLDFTDMIAEGDGPKIPYVSDIAHKMHDVPPFNLLHKVAKGIERVAKNMMERLSVWAAKLAGGSGPHEYKIIPSIVGIAGEVKVKGVAKGALVALIPGLGQIAGIISMTAMVLAVIGVIENLIK